MKKTKVCAIDVGTTKVCTIMAQVHEEDLRVIGVGVAPSYGLHKGLVVNINEARESIRESVRLAERTAGAKMESAYIGVTGRHISSVNNRGSIAITRNDQLVKREDLKRVLDVARNVQVPNELKLLHVIPRSYTVDGQEGVKNPIGMHGFRLDVETHIISAAVTSIQNLTKCIRNIGIEIDDVIMEPLASGEAVLFPDEKKDGIAVADIGGGTTDIAIFKENTIYHTSVLPVAGYQITRDISVGLGLSYEMAEEMKKKYGNVMPGDEANTEDYSLTQDGHNISYQDLSRIIRARVEELLRLVVLEMPQQDRSKLVPAGLVLTGGGSNLPGIAELAETITRMPVRVGRPMNLLGVADVLDNPAYATSVGLLLWKMRNQGTQTLQGQETGIRRFVSHLMRLFR
jgi:cell division protein FtsA